MSGIRPSIGQKARVKDTGCNGIVTAENGHACKVSGYWYLFDEVEQLLPKKPIESATGELSVVLRRSWLLEQHRGHPSEHYQLLEELGRGSFGVVHLVHPLRGGEDLVCKVIDKQAAYGSEITDAAAKAFQDEIKLLQTLDHPNVNRLLEHYEDHKNLYIILGLASGGDLEELICLGTVEVSEAWLAKVFRQVLEATAYCHSHSVIHKDMKPENVMFLTKDYVNPHVVVIDFGAAELFYKHSLKFAGTPGYIAPEVWQAALGLGHFGPKCDVYSIGAMLFYSLSEAELPWFRADTTGGDFKKYAKKCIFIFKTRSIAQEFDGTFQGSSEARDLVLQMLAHDSRERISAEGCLAHHWLERPSRAECISSAAVLAMARNAKKNRAKKRFLLEAAMLIAPSKLDDINSIFKALDVNHNGTLSLEELKEGFQSLGMAAQSAEALADSLDLDKNGEVEYTEFLSGLADHCTLHFKEALWAVFCKYDADRSGYIDVAEFEELLRSDHFDEMSLQSRKEAAQELLERVDRDGDHRISFDELCSYVIPETSGAAAAARSDADDDLQQE